jgi:hypothetical protein
VSGSDLSSVSFSSFIISLAASAMVHLGETPDPSSGQREVHLELARHSIDALGMLEGKTSGNLDDDEARLLASLLHELRTKFVDKARETR